MHIQWHNRQLERCHAVRPDDAIVVVVLLDGGCHDSAYPNAIAAHGYRDIFTVFVQHLGIHGLAVFGA